MRNELLILLIMSVATTSSDPGPHALSTAVINRYKEFKRLTASAHHHTLINVNNYPSNAENVTSRIKQYSLDAYSFALTDSLHRLSDSGNISSRSKRSPNDAAFSTLQSHISALARIVTGISLYNGLVDNSISSNQAITGLMNLGSISLKELEKFDKKKVDDFVKLLMDTSNALDTNTVATEQRIIDLHTMKNMWNDVGDLRTIPNKTRFDSLKFLVNMDLSGLENFKVGADSQKSLKSLRSVSKSAIDVIENGKASAILKEMGPFQHFAQMVEYYFGSTVVEIKLAQTKTIDSVKGDLEKVQGLGSNTGSVFTTLSKIVSSRSESNTDVRQHTSGFINGFLDLKLVVKDAEDEWIRRTLKSLDLKDGMSVFNDLPETMTQLDEKWNAARTEPVKQSIQQAENYETSAKTMKYDASSFDTIMSNFRSCSFPTPSQDFKNDAVTLGGNSKKVMKKIEAIYSISRSAGESNENSSEVLEYLKPHLKTLSTGKKVNELVKEVMSKSDFYLDVRDKNYGKDYLDFFECLKNLKKDSSGLSTAAQLALDLRNLKKMAKFDTDMATASSAIAGSTDLIATIKSKIDEVKSLESGKKLIGLKELAKFSKPIGDASEVLSRVQKVLERKKELLDFVENGHSVEEAVEKLSAPSQQFEVRRDWVGFDELSSQILEQLDKIQKWADGLVKSEELNSYGAALEKLAGLGDVELAMDRRLIALDSLITFLKLTSFTSQTEEVVNFKKMITPLESLNLHFSKFDASLSQMSSTLAGLQNSGETAGNHTTMTTAPIEEKSEFDWTWVYVVAAVIILLLLVVIGLEVRFKCLTALWRRRPVKGTDETSVGGDRKRPTKGKRKLFKSKIHVPDADPALQEPVVKPPVNKSQAVEIGKLKRPLPRGDQEIPQQPAAAAPSEVAPPPTKDPLDNGRREHRQRRGSQSGDVQPPSDERPAKKEEPAGEGKKPTAEKLVEVEVLPDGRVMVKAGEKLKAGQQVIIRPPKKLNPLQKVDNPKQVRPGFKIDDVRYKPRLPYVVEYFEDQNDDNTLDNVASICNSSSRIN